MKSLWCCRYGIVLVFVTLCFLYQDSFGQTKNSPSTNSPTLPPTEAPRLTDNPDQVFGDSSWTFGNFKKQMAMMMIGDLANCDENHPFVKITTDGDCFWYHLWAFRRHAVAPGQVASICYCVGDIRLVLNRARLATKVSNKLLWSDAYYMSIMRVNRFIRVDSQVADQEELEVIKLFTLAQQLFDEQRQKVPVNEAQVISPKPADLDRLEKLLKNWGDKNAKWAEAKPR